MDLLKLREQFSKEGIMMCFNGPFSHSIIEELGTAIKNHLGTENTARSAILDVFSVYIEMTQNVRNYQMSKESSSGDTTSATIMIARKGDAYVITSGNPVEDKDAEILVSRIERINLLDQDQLKKAIRSKLREETPEGASGAGIGLMEIARRSMKGLEYSLCKIGGGYSFFTLRALIRQNQ